MRILIVGSLVLVGWLGFGAYWHTCQIKCLCGDETVVVPDEEDPKITLKGDQPGETDGGDTSEGDPNTLSSRAWTISDGNGQPMMEFPASARFAPGSADLQFDQGSEGLPDSIYNYLLANPEHFIEITGYTGTGDVDAPANDDLALDRAQALKDILVAKGVNPDRIIMVDGSEERSSEENGDLLSGLDLKLMHMSVEMEEEVDVKIAHKTLYCEFNEIQFLPDPKLKEYASELKSYLQRHPGEIATITGHTDDIGPSGANMWIGKKRARTVRDYFVSEGVPKKRMKIATRGEHDPVADNSTENGQAKNRRIEVIIK